jgi:hypothetical protein
MYQAMAGAAGAVGGSVLNGIGQAMALSAMSKAARNARARQAEYDRQNYEDMTGFVGGITPESLVPVAGQNEQVQRSDRDQSAIMRAALGQAARRSGGRDPEMLAVFQGNMPGIAAQNHNRASLDALMNAWNQGAEDLSRGSRELAFRKARRQGEAELWQSLLPYELREAANKGSEFRTLGSLLSMLGQGGMNYGMSQPMEEA